MKCPDCGNEVFYISVANREPRFSCARCGKTHFHKPAELVARIEAHSSAEASSVRRGRTDKHDLT